MFLLRNMTRASEPVPLNLKMNQGTGSDALFMVLRCIWVPGSMPRPRYPLKTGHEVEPIVSFCLFDKLQIPCVSFRYGTFHGDLVKIP